MTNYQDITTFGPVLPTAGGSRGIITSNTFQYLIPHVDTGDPNTAQAYFPGQINGENAYFTYAGEAGTLQEIFGTTLPGGAGSMSSTVITTYQNGGFVSSWFCWVPDDPAWDGWHGKWLNNNYSESTIILQPGDIIRFTNDGNQGNDLQVTVPVAAPLKNVPYTVNPAWDSGTQKFAGQFIFDEAPQTNDTVRALDTNKTHQFNGSSWVEQGQTMAQQLTYTSADILLERLQMVMMNEPAVIEAAYDYTVAPSTVAATDAAHVVRLDQLQSVEAQIIPERWLGQARLINQANWRTAPIENSEFIFFLGSGFYGDSAQLLWTGGNTTLGAVETIISDFISVSGSSIYSIYSSDGVNRLRDSTDTVISGQIVQVQGDMATRAALDGIGGNLMLFSQQGYYNTSDKNVVSPVKHNTFITSDGSYLGYYTGSEWILVGEALIAALETSLKAYADAAASTAEANAIAAAATDATTKADAAQAAAEAVAAADATAKADAAQTAAEATASADATSKANAAQAAAISTAATDATTKANAAEANAISAAWNYTDSEINALKQERTHQVVAGLETANVDLTSLPGTIGGLAPVAGYDFALTGQTDGIQNGFYTFDGTNLVRADWAPDTDNVAGVRVRVTDGDHAGEIWDVYNSTSSATVGTDALDIREYVVTNVTGGEGLVQDGSVIKAATAPVSQQFIIGAAHVASGTFEMTHPPVNHNGVVDVTQVTVIFGVQQLYGISYTVEENAGTYTVDFSQNPEFMTTVGNAPQDGDGNTKLGLFISYLRAL